MSFFYALSAVSTSKLQPSTPIAEPHVVKQTQHLESSENITRPNKETPAVKTNSLVGDEKGA